MQVLLENEQKTLAFGQKLAALCEHVQIILLKGPLGAGKTTLTRGLLQGLGYRGTVKSPTYTLVETYTLDHRTVHHFDLYRLGGTHALEEMGVRDYFSEDALCLIEWPEKINTPIVADLICSLEILGNQRQISIIAQTPAGRQVIEQLQS